MKSHFPPGRTVRLLVLACALAALVPAAASASGNAGPRNVLFIAVDDLRPMLECYGDRLVKTPNIDRLAARGVLFERAYCQVAVCGPSRASMLTGRRPATTRIFDNSTEFRAYLPDVRTLPEQLRVHGYHTAGFGKIFHSQWDDAYVGRRMDDARSWSEPAWFPPTVQFYFTEEGQRTAREVYARTADCGLFQGGQCLHTLRSPAAKPLAQVDVADPEYDDWKRHFVMGLLAEAPDVPDSTLYDGQVADRAVEALRRLRDERFFIAVGFTRPHIPCVAPKRYWDLYDPAQFKPAANPFPPRGALPWTLGEGQVNGTYYGMPRDGQLDEAQARHLIHGYHASVSYVDAQVGRIMGELDSLGLAENTVVVFWSDHGYHLGENGQWGKSTCLEMGTRTPLIIAAPGLKGNGRKSRALVEAVDIYPTLCELTGVPLADGLEGTSMAPLLADPARAWKAAAFSQYPRPVRASTPHARPAPDDKMGYTIRTDRYRYVEWHSLARPGEIVGRELYDHHADPEENNSLAGDASQEAVIRHLHGMLQAGWRAARPQPQP